MISLQNLNITINNHNYNQHQHKKRIETAIIKHHYSQPNVQPCQKATIE